MKPQTLMTLRRYHLYLGVFFAPAIILFSISGALQTFRLPEEKGWGSPPPTWMVWFASIHKDQSPPRIEAPEAEHHDDHEEAAKAPAPVPKPALPAEKRPNTLPLKIFVVIMAIGLLLSTLVGLTLAFANKRTRPTYLAIMVAGAVLPCVLLYL